MIFIHGDGGGSPGITRFCASEAHHEKRAGQLASTSRQIVHVIYNWRVRKVDLHPVLKKTHSCVLTSYYKGTCNYDLNSIESLL